MGGGITFSNSLFSISFCRHYSNGIRWQQKLVRQSSDSVCIINATESSRVQLRQIESFFFLFFFVSFCIWGQAGWAEQGGVAVVVECSK